MKVLSAHYPEYFPSITFFQKLLFSDVFIIIDNIQFSKNKNINRAKIKTKDGAQWITVPVLKKEKDYQKIFKIKIDSSSNWRRKHLRTIYVSYKNAPYFEKYFPEIKTIILLKNIKKLLTLNLKIINYIINELEIGKKILIGSKIKLKEKGRNLISEMLLKTGCNAYLVEKKYDNYLTPIKNKTNIIFKDFKPIFYQQLFNNFIPDLSIIDLLFNYGKESKSIIIETS